MNTIEHLASTQRFQTTADGHVAYVEYVFDGDVMVITHTIVPDAIAGRGIAGGLVKAALDYAREEGWKVDPACSYAEAWIARHPDYADLLDN